jgi:hypothetical protein
VRSFSSGGDLHQREELVEDFDGAHDVRLRYCLHIEGNLRGAPE